MAFNKINFSAETAKDLILHGKIMLIIIEKKISTTKKNRKRK